MTGTYLLFPLLQLLDLKPAQPIEVHLSFKIVSAPAPFKFKLKFVGSIPFD